MILFHLSVMKERGLPNDSQENRADAPCFMDQKDFVWLYIAF